MRYLGSKVSVVEHIHREIARLAPSGTFCDPFGGVGVVGAYFKQRGYRVWSGDALTFAHYFQVARIQRNTRPSFRALCQTLGVRSRGEVVDRLNRQRKPFGWLYREYSERRRFFTPDNAAVIEGCRALIGRWARKGLLTSTERALLLASLIESMDKVANTAGTYYAYLKNWYRKALRPFRFRLIDPTPGRSSCRAMLCDATELVGKRHFDVLYLDPPYNERCYAAYYHLPESIARLGAPRVRGASGVPERKRVLSDFNRPRAAPRALRELLAVADCRLLAFHYSDAGLIEPDELRETLGSYGRVTELVVNATGYVTSPRCRLTKHRLYLVTHA